MRYSKIIYQKIFQALVLQATINMWMRYLSLDAAGDDGSLFPEHFLGEMTVNVPVTFLIFVTSFTPGYSQYMFFEDFFFFQSCFGLML